MSTVTAWDTVVRAPACHLSGVIENKSWAASGERLREKVSRCDVEASGGGSFRRSNLSDGRDPL